MMRIIPGLIGLLIGLALAATSVAEDTSPWRSLSHEDFAGRGAADLKGKQASRSDVEAEAKRRLVETDAADVAPYSVLSRIAEWGGPRLSDAEKTAAVAKLQARKDKGPQLPFADLQYRSYVLASLTAVEQSDRELLAWIDAHDLAQLEVPQIEWFCFQLGHSDQRGDRIQIEWSGLLRLEKQGIYVFSPSRICTDRDWAGGRIRSNLQVTLGGGEILNTAENGWQTESRPLLLDNSRDLSLKVTFTHDRVRNDLGTSCPAIAMLYWKGPGFERQLIPTAALKTADGKGAGLNAQYKLLESNFETRDTKLLKEFTRIDLQIDAAWWQSHNTGFRPRPAQLDKLLEHLVTRYNNAEYLEKFRADSEQRNKRELDQWRKVSELMTTPQRKQFLQVLLEHPKFLESLRLIQVRRLHQYTFPGNDEQAIEVFKPWLHAQSDLVQPPFLEQPRPVHPEFQTMVDDLVMLPSAVEYLREHLVARPDGSCCLLAAYLAAYGSTFESDRDACANFIDQRLSDLQLGGDRRVGWLLARAVAEGVRSNQRRHLYINNLNGWPWLEEAMETAESEPLKLLVARHQAARLLDAKKISQLRQTIQEAQKQLTSAESQAALSKWQTELTKLGVTFQTANAPAPQPLTDKEREQYLKVLRFRADEADERGDAEAASRYRALIAKVEADGPPDESKPKEAPK